MMHSRLRQIRPKMILFFLLTGLLPLLLAGYLGTTLAKDALMEKSLEQMQAIQSIRASQVAHGFQDRLNGLGILARYDSLKTVYGDLEDYRRRTSSSPREDMETASEEYRAIIRSFHGLMEEFLAAYKYRDFYLISGEQGHVLFSVHQKDDTGTSLRYGRYKNSALALLLDEISRTGTMAVMDFAPYSPDGDGQYAFLGVPLYSDTGTWQGIAALQIGTEFISDMLDSQQGMGETGESYLLRWYREDNSFSIRSRIYSMGLEIGQRLSGNLEYWEDAVSAGHDGGQGTYVDSIGNKVLVTYSSLNFRDLDWYLISKRDEAEVTRPLRKLMLHILQAGFVMAVLIIFFAFSVAGNITGPILESRAFAWDIAHGNLEGVLPFEDRRDELGELAASLNLMCRNLKELDWLKTGKEGLDDALRGEWDPQELCSRFIRFFTGHCGAQMGAVYLRQDDDEEMLELIAGHALTDGKKEFDRIRLGEGMIGQAAQEKGPVYFSRVPEGLPVLHYGIAEEIPPHFMIAPFLYQERVLGVFFIASMTPFSESQKLFALQNIGNAAILINTTKSRDLINRLLRNTQEQREELRVINEELEAQTQALKESEEELRVTNEELEERTQALEEQTNSVTFKNTELIKAQEEIEKKAKDLEMASRYKSEFLANMSHELRTPLNSILILSQLFSNNRDGNLTAKQIESSQAIYSSGSDLLKLINEILDLSKVEAGKIELNPEEMPFDGMISDLKRVFRDLAKEKGIDFKAEIAEGVPPSIYVDSHRLQQVLRNLLTNAFKFTKEQGHVTLRVEELPEERTGAYGLPSSEAVAIHVEDDGIGIPEGKQAAIFEAFQQADGSTSRKYGGTGLGLSISRELTRLLGGNITLESKTGEGSTFTVILPRLYAPRKEADPQEAGDPLPAPVPEAPDPKRAQETPLPPAREMLQHMEVHDDRSTISREDKSLLIIEDDPRFIRILKDLAKERGFQCLIAEDGETGLHFADFYRPKAIILDIELPGIDGWTVMERLKENPQLRHIPVHFMSGSDQVMDAMRMGAIGYLTKPADLGKIEAAFGEIEELIDRSVRKLLIVEDDAVQRESIIQLIGNGDVESLSAATGREAFDKLKTHRFDCMILDLGLEDMSGYELLEKIRKDETISRIPVIIYTGRDLTREEEEKLRPYSESIIIKGAKSPERLLDESALFLHRVESAMPPGKQRMLKMTYDQDAVFREKKILLADDDMRNVFALSSVLEEKNMDVLIAKNGLESLTALEEHEDVNLVLMDIMMPEMDGYEAMRRIRQQHKFRKLPIIALTAKAMKGDRNKCIEAGASDYLAKPVDTEKLLSMLKVWLYES